MKIYSFKDYSSNMWEVLSDDGSRMKYNFFTEKKAKELITKWYGDVEFVTKHWLSPEIIAAKQAYEKFYGCSWEGHCE